MKHTPEPWKATRAHEQYDGPYWDLEPEEAEEYAARPYTGIQAPGNLTVVTAHDLFTFRQGDAARIVACVNACAGMEDPGAEVERLRDALFALVKTVDATGGLVVNEDCGEGPAGDPEWGDLADAYRMACEALGVDPVVGEEINLEDSDDA